MNIYQEHILDHYSNPRNKGTIENPDIYYRDTNPLCGDEVAIFAKLNENKVHQISFLAKGCAISQASASILSEHAKGKGIEELYKITSEEMIELLMIPISPARLKCAVLPIKTFQAGIMTYKSRKNGNT